MNVIFALLLACATDATTAQVEVPVVTGATAAAVAPAAEAKPVADASSECEVEMSVSGMSCSVNCAPKVKAALESVPGVASVDVSFDASSASVFADGESCDDGKPLLDALTETGAYTGEVVAVKKT